MATLDAAAQLAGKVRDIAHLGDYVVLLGAVNITQWAYYVLRVEGVGVRDVGRNMRTYCAASQPLFVAQCAPPLDVDRQADAVDKRGEGDH